MISSNALKAVLLGDNHQGAYIAIKLKLGLNLI